MGKSFEELALGEFGAAAQPDLSGKVILPQTQGAIVQISTKFAFQSFFDNTALEKALQVQPQGSAIVASTLQESQLGGYAIGLHPSSQTPVAVQFKTGGKNASTGTYVIKPGQTIRPSGIDGAFNGFSWGLPYGWLGGGQATLLIYQHPQAEVAFHGNPEIIFHRARYAIKQPSDLVLALTTAPFNWPLRFPWSQATRLVSGNTINQQGNAQLAVEPTRCLLVLRGVTTLAAAADMRVVFQATNDVGLDSSDAVVLANPIFDTVTWPAFNSLGTGGNLATQNAALMITGGMLNRLAADDGGVEFVDASGTAALNGLFVDVVRYGRL